MGIVCHFSQLWEIGFKGPGSHQNAVDSQEGTWWELAKYEAVFNLMILCSSLCYVRGHAYRFLKKESKGV